MNLLDKIEMQSRAGASRITDRFNGRVRQSRKALLEISQEELKKQMTQIALEVMFTKRTKRNGT